MDGDGGRCICYARAGQARRRVSHLGGHDSRHRQGNFAGGDPAELPAHCRAALGHLGLLPYFETIIFAHDLGIEKKNPEIYHLAARQLGVRESECTMFDDSVEALRGAKSAGMRTVGVADPYFAREQDALRAVCDRYIESFEELLSPSSKGSAL